MYVVVRVRGNVKVRGDIKDTMKMLGLKAVNNCVVVSETPQIRGMIQKVKDYVTFGEIEKDVLKKLLLKRGRTENGKRINEKYMKDQGYSIDNFIDLFLEEKIKLKDVKIKTVFRLHPPRKGYEGIKRPFSMKGALGYRGKEINKLLERMI